MTPPVTHFKIGLFALAAITGVAVAIVGLGVHARHAPTTRYHVLLDESVQGLKLGAPVKYRGMPIGDVARIEVAEDRRRIDVSLAIDVTAEHRLALADAPARLRAELANQGLTGVKFVELDFADPSEEAAPQPPHYLASRPSLGRRLEEEGSKLGRSLPALVEDMRATLDHVNALIDTASTSELPAHLISLADHARAAFDDARNLMPRASAMLASVRHLADDAGIVVPDVHRVLARVDGDDGMLASVRRATEAVDELGRRTVGSTSELEQTLHDVGEAARTLRGFIEQLDLEPDMLLKGRAPARRP